MKSTNKLPVNPVALDSNMEKLPSLELLIEYLRRLPSVGAKSAERMAYAILKMPEQTVGEFADALRLVKENVHFCPQCGLYTENTGLCDICLDTSRDHQLLVVVGEPKDVASFERVDEFNGVYHVLGGVISASSNIGIKDLRIDSLFERIEKQNVQEVIIATNPTLEGETTALYLARLLADTPAKVTRIGYGLPMGGQLDYADSLTIKRALHGRTNMKDED